MGVYGGALVVSLPVRGRLIFLASSTSSAPPLRSPPLGGETGGGGFRFPERDVMITNGVERSQTMSGSWLELLEKYRAIAVIRCQDLETASAIASAVAAGGDQNN